MSSDAQLLKESLALVENMYDKMTGYFYARLFVENPPLRNMFPLAMDTQRDRLFRSLVSIVQGIERPELLVPYLQQLGRDHRKFGVQPEHYDAIGRALIGAVKEYSYGNWEDETEAAWWRAYSIAARTMIDAAERASGAPAYWLGEVVRHELRTEDIAVLWLRTDHPYPFEAGQYANVETPRLPRVWRPYSIANAPSVGGLLELHVRMIGAGWVSRALVRKTQVGDVLRLGPAVGSTVLNRSSERDIVCVAGGTGLAPMKAMIDELSRWNTARNVHLFFGARQARELYDLEALRELEARLPWLTLVTAVSHDPDYPGECGMLPDVVARHGTWYAHDVYASGSPDMVRSTVAGFRDLRVPLERIRYDVFGELEQAASGYH